MADGWNIDRTRLAWWFVGLALGVAVLFVVYSFIGTFVFGVFIYYATRPVYKRLRRRIRPASLAAATALVALALPVLLLMAYTGGIALQELNKVLTNVSPNGLGESFAQYQAVSELAQSPQRLVENVSDPTVLRDLSDPDSAVRQAVQGVGRSALEYVGFIGNAVLHLFVMIAIAFYLLRDDHRLSRFFRRQFGDEGGVVEAYVRQVDRDFNSIFFGNILNALLTGTIGAAAYNALNMVGPPEFLIPYPTLLGLLTGAASLIPIVGMKLVYFPVSAYLGLEVAFADPALGPMWFPALFFAVSLVVVDTIPDLVLRPYVSGRNLHVGLVMLAYIFGPLLFGWYGIFLGPMILVLVVHFVRIVLPELVTGEPIRPWAVDPTYLFEPETAATEANAEAAPSESAVAPGDGTDAATEPDESWSESDDGDAPADAETPPEN